jgi:corrinoid protein of di/trimethylamine methyltransferase
MVFERKEILNLVSKCVVDLDIEGIKKAVTKAIEAGIHTHDIIKSMSEGMEVVGKKFEDKEYFLPELVMAGETMKAGMALLEPLIEAEKQTTYGVVVIGTVKGDLHDIGKNIVINMLRASGFTVHDLGVDVSAKDFVDKVKETKADIVGMSALLLSTMPYMKVVIDALKEAGLRSKVKVIIGGRPVTAEFAHEIGADAYVKEAVEAPKVVKDLIKSSQS